MQTTVLVSRLYLFRFTEHQCIDGALFIPRCYESGNLSAIFINRTHDYFVHSERDEGIYMIKMAVYGACEIALYIYIMLPKTVHNDDAYLSLITKESVRRISLIILIN